MFRASVGNKCICMFAYMYICMHVLANNISHSLERKSIYLLTTHILSLPLLHLNISWLPSRSLLQLEEAETRGILARKTSLAHLAAHFKELKGDLPPVVGRVVVKSQLSYFASLNDDSRKLGFPCQAYIVIDDGTAEAVTVLWYSTCRDFFTSIQPGDVIALDGYRVRSITNYGSVYSTDARIELSVNSQKPMGKIYIMHRPSMNALLEKPLVRESLPLVCLKEARLLPDSTSCDIIARLVHVGRLEVDQYKQKHFLYRWVTLRDDSSARPLLAKLYSCSQERHLTRLRAGILLHMTNMVSRTFVFNSRVPPLCILRSSKTTFYTSAPVSPLAIDILPDTERARAVCTWALHSGEDLDFREGGLISFPPSTRFRHAPPTISPVPISLAADVAMNLRHLERRQLVVQGFVCRVLYKQAGDSAMLVNWVAPEDLLPRNAITKRGHRRGRLRGRGRRRGKRVKKEDRGTGAPSIRGKKRQQHEKEEEEEEEGRNKEREEKGVTLQPGIGIILDGAHPAEGSAIVLSTAVRVVGRAVNGDAHELNEETDEEEEKSGKEGERAKKKDRVEDPSQPQKEKGHDLQDALVPTDVDNIDESRAPPHWSVLLTGLNQDLTLEAIIPYDDGPGGILPPLLRHVPGFPGDDLVAEDDDSRALVEICKQIKGKRLAAVVDLFCHNGRTEITLNRWLGSDQVVLAGDH